MATLVGIDDSTGYATNLVLSGDRVYTSNQSGYTAVATGTADTAWVYLNQVGATESIKILVYDSSRNLLATSTPWVGTGYEAPVKGWISTPISISITSGTTYILGCIANNFMYVQEDNTDNNLLFDDTGSYASPPDPVANNTSPIGNYIIYLSGPVSDVTGTFSNKYGNPQAGLSGLNWAFFDQNIGSLVAPTATGGVATSGLDGTFTIDVTGTSLTSGQTGTLVIYDSTGEKYGAYRAIIGANGTIRLDAPGLASSYYLDGQADVIGQILTPPMGPLR